MTCQSWKIGCMYKTPFRKFGHILYLRCEDAVLDILCTALPTTIAIPGECRNFCIIAALVQSLNCINLKNSLTPKCQKTDFDMQGSNYLKYLSLYY